LTLKLRDQTMDGLSQSRPRRSRPRLL
jgi:hypothetical protein